MVNNDGVNERLEAALSHIEHKLLDSLRQKDIDIQKLTDQKEQLQKTIQEKEQEIGRLEKRIETELTVNLATEQKVASLQDELATVNVRLKEAIDEKKKLQNELADVKTAIANYEHKVSKLVNDKDKNIRYLRNRLTVTEQSTKFRLGTALVNSAKNPITLPKNVYLICRMFAGSIRRRVKGIKKKYKFAPLPYNDAKLPSFSLSGSFGTVDNTEEAYSGKLNELLLTGLHDPISLTELKVAAILDDFSTSCFAPDCRLITFRPDNWQEMLRTDFPHLLFVESAWKGNGGSWQYKIAKYNYKQGPELDELLAWCRHHQVPTVFWNKEDPIHFDKFIHTAKKFDVIFTSDANCIDKYKKIAGHNRVYALPFAAQPALHNPTKVKDYKEREVCFAGSYYANRHPQRREDMERLLDSALHKGLEIYDRNYGSDSEHFRFPERFQPCIKGSLPYEQLVHAYKQYKVFLNCNSVTDSPTMFSRRVFELLACGTTVVSTYGKGIAEMFADQVIMVDDDNAAVNIDQALTDAEWRTKHELVGMRTVFNKHTYRHRLYDIATKCGYELPEPYLYKVGLIGKPNTVDEAERVMDMFASQSYPHLQLYLFVKNDIDIQAEDDRITVIHGTGDKVAFTEDYIGVLSARHYYGEHYVTDLINGVKYSVADIVGKADVHVFDKENASLKRRNEGMAFVYTSELVPEASLFSTSWIASMNDTIVRLLDTERLREAMAHGARMYAIDPYNFLLNAIMATKEQYDDVVRKVSV